MLVICPNHGIKTPDGVDITPYVWRRDETFIGVDGRSRVTIRLAGVTRDAYMGASDPPGGPMRVIVSPQNEVLVPASRMVNLRLYCEHVSITRWAGYHVNGPGPQGPDDPDRRLYEVVATAEVVCEPASAGPRTPAATVAAPVAIRAGMPLALDDESGLVRAAGPGDTPIGVAVTDPDAHGNLDATLTTEAGLPTGTVKLQSRKTHVIDGGRRMETIPAEQWIVRERMRQATMALRRDDMLAAPGDAPPSLPPSPPQPIEPPPIQEIGEPVFDDGDDFFR